MQERIINLESARSNINGNINYFSPVLILYNKVLSFHLKKHCRRKGETAHNKQFLLYHHVFYPSWRTLLHFSLNSELLSVNSFSFEGSFGKGLTFSLKISDSSILMESTDEETDPHFSIDRYFLESCCGKRGKCWTQAFFPFPKCLLFKGCFKPFPNKPWFLRVCSIGLFKTLWENETLIVTSNFSFSHSVFKTFCHFHQL